MRTNAQARGAERGVEGEGEEGEEMRTEIISRSVLGSGGGAARLIPRAFRHGSTRRFLLLLTTSAAFVIIIVLFLLPLLVGRFIGR